jgi:transposase-like protein
VSAADVARRYGIAERILRRWKQELAVAPMFVCVQIGDIASVISAHELAEISAQYKRLAGFDQDSVNAKGSSSCS